MSPARGDKPYGSTTVPIPKSQEELRGLLRKFGASSFTFGEGTDWAGVEFEHDGMLVRVRCPLRQPSDADVKARRRGSHKSVDECVASLIDDEAQRVWRVLVWTVKARLVAVDEGIETFEQAFLAHFVDPWTTRTVWQVLQEPIEAGMLRRGSDGMRALMAGSTS